MSSRSQLELENARLKEMLAAQAITPPSPPLSPKRAPVQMTALPALPLDQSNPLYSVIEMLRAQLMAQAAAQEGLLSQLGELRSSHAALQATTSDVNDELVILKDKAGTMSKELGDEKDKREQAENEKVQEAEKVATLRQKMEESRRAIMRLQEEAAAKRNSDSRRSSLVSLATPTSSVIGQGVDSRRGSMTGFAFPNRRVSLISGMESPYRGSDHHRRASLAGPTALALEAKRHSMAVDVTHRRTPSAMAPTSMSCASSPGVGLGLDLSEPSHPPPPRQFRSSLSQRRRSSLGVSNSEAVAETKEELRAMALKASTTTEEPSNANIADMSYASRRQSSLSLSLNTQIDEEGPDSARILPKRVLRMSMDASDLSRNHSLSTRPSSFSHPRSDRQNESAEVMLLRAQLSAAQNKLAEVEEAKTASDTCLHALKDFISTSSVSGAAESIKLPPLPTEDVDDEDEKPATVSEAPTRRPSLWNLAPFMLKGDAPALPTKEEPKTATQPSKPSSPVLTEFNDWSVRRRASLAVKEKPEAPVANSSRNKSRPGLASFDSFSFQSRIMNPALIDSPSSPGGGLSPGGRNRSSSSSRASPAVIGDVDTNRPLQTPCDGSGRFPNMSEFESSDPKAVGLAV